MVRAFFFPLMFYILERLREGKKKNLCTMLKNNNKFFIYLIFYLLVIKWEYMTREWERLHYSLAPLPIWRARPKRPWRICGWWINFSCHVGPTKICPKKVYISFQKKIYIYWPWQTVGGHSYKFMLLPNHFIQWMRSWSRKSKPFLTVSERVPV